jgi:glycerate kinase
VKILVAPDSFKGTYSADHVADAIAEGIRAAGVLPIRQPAADGKGTVSALAESLQLVTTTATAVDPWGAAIDATYGLSLSGTAVVEVAAASGHRASAVGRPGAAVRASSYGTGVLVVDAVRRGARHIVVAGGGSASTDGGLGAITAIREGGGLGNARMTVLTDVATRFTDAATVFAPQKGADACGFDASVEASAAIIVGEGRLDRQTQSGKLIDTILRRAGSRPVFAVVGSTAPDIGVYAQRFAAVLHARNPAEMCRAGTLVAQHLIDRHTDRGGT